MSTPWLHLTCHTMPPAQELLHPFLTHMYPSHHPSWQDRTQGQHSEHRHLGPSPDLWGITVSQLHKCTFQAKPTDLASFSKLIYNVWKISSLWSNLLFMPHYQHTICWVGTVSVMHGRAPCCISFCQGVVCLAQHRISLIKLNFPIRVKTILSRLIALPPWALLMLLIGRWLSK